MMAAAGQRQQCSDERAAALRNHGRSDAYPRKIFQIINGRNFISSQIQFFQVFQRRQVPCNSNSNSNSSGSGTTRQQQQSTKVWEEVVL